MDARTALHAALDLALSDSFTGDRQNALSLILAQVRDRFSPGEFRQALRKVWPEPLTEKSFALEAIEGKMAEGLDLYNAHGDSSLLVEWVARYLDASRGGA